MTEKAVRGYMHDAIPVFLGGANYSAVFPAGSFLSVRDFSSIKGLAERMHEIASDKDEYFKYFRFRYNAKMVELPVFLQPDRCSLCMLCEVLNANPPVQKVYPLMSDWWNSVQQCKF